MARRTSLAVLAAAVAMVAGDACSSSNAAADRSLAEIWRAHEEYELQTFYRESRAFLKKFGGHPDAPRVRYALALQLVTENLMTPESRDAAEARRLLEVQAAEAPQVSERFDAALLLMKFAPTPEERLRRAGEVLGRFASHPALDQVYFWLVDHHLSAGDAAAASTRAKELLARFPDTPDAGDFRRIIRRAELIGRPLSLPPEVLQALGGPWPGKVAIVDFWATWCGPCVAEVPRLRAFAEAHGARGLAVAAISLDEEEQPYRVYLAQANLPWPVLRAGAGDGGLADTLGVSDLPVYLLVDRRGVVVETELRGESLYRRARELLELGAP